MSTFARWDSLQKQQQQQFLKQQEQQKKQQDRIIGDFKNALEVSIKDLKQYKGKFPDDIEKEKLRTFNTIWRRLRNIGYKEEDPATRDAIRQKIIKDILNIISTKVLERKGTSLSKLTPYLFPEQVMQSNMMLKEKSIGRRVLLLWMDALRNRLTLGKKHKYLLKKEKTPKTIARSISQWAKKDQDPALAEALRTIEKYNQKHLTKIKPQITPWIYSFDKSRTSIKLNKKSLMDLTEDDIKTFQKAGFKGFDNKYSNSVEYKTNQHTTPQSIIGAIETIRPFVKRNPVQKIDSLNYVPKQIRDRVFKGDDDKIKQMFQVQNLILPEDSKHQIY